MKRVVFLDVSCPKPYSHETLLNGPMGGTEATVVRVAEALAGSGRYKASVVQHNREAATYSPNGVEYTGFFDAESLGGSDVVVTLRDPKVTPFAIKRFPNAKPILWLHDFNAQAVVEDYPILEGTGIHILGVSRYHKTSIADVLLRQVADIKGVTVGHIYNPIDDSLLPDSTPINTHKLVYFSSPHKGLEQTIKIFRNLREIDNKFELHVANPGYLPNAQDLPAGVINHGSLPHHQVMQHVREALCVFHLNKVFPETFGLVHAEANAVGTPCLTAPFGANPEVLTDKRQFLNVLDDKMVIDRVIQWADDERPAVKGNMQFRMSNVLRAWEGLING